MDEWSERRRHADMRMDPSPCGPAGIGAAVGHARFAQEGPRTVAKPLLCSPGGGTGNNQRHARQRDCRRTAGNLQHIDEYQQLPANERVAAPSHRAGTRDVGPDPGILLTDRGNSADPDRNRDAALSEAAREYSAVRSEGAYHQNGRT